MKTSLIFLFIPFLTIAQLTVLPKGNIASDRTISNLNSGWIFHLGDFGWYRKTIKLNGKPSEKLFIEFEDVYSATELWVNGKKAGISAVNGYVPFLFDINAFVKFGDLYRDLHLVTANKLHFTFNWEDFEAGVNINTPTVNKKNRTVSIKTTVKNEDSKPINSRIETIIINAEDYVLKKLIHKSTIAANSNHTFRQTTSVEDDYHLWSSDKPYLYWVYSVIYEHETPVDFVENTFGFRIFSFVNSEGLVLNGEPLLLVGVNRHQNYSNIGDALSNSFHYKEALQYKYAGINIISLSHYTQDDSFIKACDDKISNISMLGRDETLKWSQDDSSLSVQIPSKKLGDYAFVL